MLCNAYDDMSNFNDRSKHQRCYSLCSSQRHGSTMTNAMKSDLPDTIWDVMQTNHRNSAPSIDKSCHMIRS